MVTASIYQRDQRLLWTPISNVYNEARTGGARHRMGALWPYVSCDENSAVSKYWTSESLSPDDCSFGIKKLTVDQVSLPEDKKGQFASQYRS